MYKNSTDNNTLSKEEAQALLADLAVKFEAQIAEVRRRVAVGEDLRTPWVRGTDIRTGLPESEGTK
jgi:hypothetical protein